MIPGLTLEPLPSYGVQIGRLLDQWHVESQLYRSKLIHAKI